MCVYLRGERERGREIKRQTEGGSKMEILFHRVRGRWRCMGRNTRCGI